MTITANTGYAITSAVYTFSNNTDHTFTDGSNTTTTGESSGDTDTFTSESGTSSLTITNTNTSNQLKITQVVVTYSVDTSKGQTSLTFTQSSVEVGKSSSAQTITNTATLTDADGNAIENASITYSSSSETITVADDGTVTIPADADYGTSATITATYAGDDSYYSSTASYMVLVVYKPGDGVVADELTYEKIGMSSTSYTDYTYAASSGTGITYTGNWGGSNSSIQLRSDNSNSGICSTSLYGKLVAIVAEFNTNTTSGRVVNVYGSSTPYSAASELYSSDTQGTKIGSLTYTTGTTYTVLEVSDKYNYVGIRSNSSALYLDKVTFYWQKTNDVAVTIAESGYSTFSATSAVTIPTGITAYQATNVSGTKVTLEALTGNVIPANTGVVINGTASANVTFEETSDDASDTFSSNMLIAASDDKCPTSFTNNTEYYALTNGYWYLIDSSVTEVPANKAILYIQGGVSASAPLETTFADNLTNGSDRETTGISNITAKTQQNDGVYYNLQGMRVANPTSGLYIVNGKKVIIK